MTPFRRHWLSIFIAIITALCVTSGARAETATDGDAAVDARAPQIIEAKRLTIEVEGSGPDVILIPGLSSPRAVWDGTRAALAGKYRLHLVQIRGFGDDAEVNADGPVLEPFIEELADYIDDAIVDPDRDAHHRPRPAIVGHSLGGLSALMLGARYPQLTGRIMVVDALPFIGTLFNPAATADSVRPQAEAMAAMIRATYGQTTPAATSADPGERSMAGNLSNSVAGRTAVAHWTAVSDPRVTATLLYEDFVTDLRAELPKVTAPVTLLYAQDDRLMSPERAEATFVPHYAGTPRFTAHRIGGSYHFIMLDQPDAFHARLRDFLAQDAADDSTLPSSDQDAKPKP